MHIVATHDIPHFGKVNVVAQMEDGPAERPFYDLFDAATGECLTEVDIFWDQPDAQTVTDFLNAAYPAVANPHRPRRIR